MKPEYSIGQVAKQFGLPVSTLRYYDREGLFPGLERSGGIRRFGLQELERLRLIECLKRSGLEIRDIRQFMEWCTEGSGTYAQRLELFVRQEERVRAELDKLQKALDVIRFKRWYYEQALQDERGVHQQRRRGVRRPQDADDVVGAAVRAAGLQLDDGLDDEELQGQQPGDRAPSVPGGSHTGHGPSAARGCRACSCPATTRAWRSGGASKRCG